MLELYSAPQSTCSQKVRLTLAEKNLNTASYQRSWMTARRSSIHQ